MVLLVGEKDLLVDGRSSVPMTTVFAETLEAYGTDVEVVLVAGGNHNNVMHPDTDAGQTTLQTVADILNSLP
jgi:hypothetical protein